MSALPRSVLAALLGALVLLLMAGSARLSWTWQANDYAGQLATLKADHADAMAALERAAAEQLRGLQAQRVVLEQRLAANDQSHYLELSNAQTAQARLRDRLATADLRLSVLLAATEPGAGQPVSGTAGAGGVVHGAARGELDRSAAQRIVAIAGDGDAGLIALAACQGYVRALTPANGKAPAGGGGG